MSDKSVASRNPLEMRKLGYGGPFVLPPMSCSQRRQEYFQRANRILSTYTTITGYSSQGQQAVEKAVAASQISDDTPMRISMGEHTIQTTFRMIRSAFAKAGGQLTNQVFLMIYGNFEAYVADLVQDALTALGIPDPIQETIMLTSTTKWAGKLDRIAQKFSLPLGRGRYIAAYEAIDMGFLGRATTDPVELLQAMADFRHRLVHSAGRADAKLLSDYPQSGLSEGDLIQLPFGFPFNIHFFFVPLTDLLDNAFCSKFEWPRSVTQVEKLIDADFRIV